MARKVNLLRSSIDKSSYFWTKICGVCHPGGGPGEFDRKGNRYDEFAKDSRNHVESCGDNFLDGDYYKSNWAQSGVSEADCFVCHLEGYDWKARALALRGGFFAEAATVGAGWYRDLETSEPPVSSLPPQAVSFQIDYSRTAIADPGNLATAIIKEVPDENCWNCHVMPDRMKRGRTWNSESDVHKAKGLSCTYCHPAGEDHEIAKGDVLIGSVRDDLDNSMKSCAQCHLEDADSRAPKAKHHFPALHLERMSCETCHIPYKDNPAVVALDNATSGSTVRYSTNDFLSNDPLDPAHHHNDLPKTRWYPALVKYKGKIKPVDPMQVIWWGDWDRNSRRVIPIFLWRIRGLTGASPENRFSITNANLLEVLEGSNQAINTWEEIKMYLLALSEAKDQFGCPLVCHTPVLVKGGMIYYFENGQLHRAPIPVGEGGFRCCEPFDLSHNIVNGEVSLGAKGCTDCHTRPSPFFNRKILIDPAGPDGKPIYREAWEILGYSEKRLEALTRKIRK